MPNYQTKNEGHPFLDEKERQCCTEPKPPGDGDAHDCVAIWKVKLNTAANAFNIASAKEAKWTRAYGDAFACEVKLKDWIANANAAHEKAVLVFAELNNFLTAVTRMETNTARTAKAIEAVLCLV